MVEEGNKNHFAPLFREPDQQAVEVSDRGECLKQFFGPWIWTQSIVAQRWLLVPVQGVPQPALGVALVRKQIHLCFSEALPDHSHYGRVEAPMVSV